jgi:hypothetical protein
MLKVAASPATVLHLTVIEELPLWDPDGAVQVKAAARAGRASKAAKASIFF